MSRKPVGTWLTSAGWAVALVALLAAGCGGPAGSDGTGHPLAKNSPAIESPIEIPLWVDLTCDAGGNPVYGTYSVVKLPNEKVLWSMAVLDTGDCRIYGAIVPQGVTQPDLCDIRFRSKKGVFAGRCRCVAGRYDLEEGRPTSQECCQKFPNAIYCKQPATGPTPVPPPTPPIQQR